MPGQPLLKGAVQAIITPVAIRKAERGPSWAGVVTRARFTWRVRHHGPVGSSTSLWFGGHLHGCGSVQNVLHLLDVTMLADALFAGAGRPDAEKVERKLRPEDLRGLLTRVDLLREDEAMPA